MLQNMVLGPLSRTLGLVIIFAVFSLATGSINGWYLLAEPAWVYNDNERFDRFVIYDEATHDSTDAAWEAATMKDDFSDLPAGGPAANTIYVIESSTSTCDYTTDLTDVTSTVLTPLGDRNCV